MQIQRKLQIEIENQGKRLQMMFEKQREMEDGKLKGSSSSMDEPFSPVDHKSDKSLSNAKTIPEESSEHQHASEKLETGNDMDVHKPENDHIDAPPTKRVKS